jgi:phage-related baseplate assembly protein
MAATPAPTFTDLFNTGKAEAQNRRPDLTFDVGDVSEFYMAAGAAMADHLVSYVTQRVLATFLDGASGDDLTTLADDRYNIQRNPATFATGTLTFTRASGALTGTIPAGTVVATVKDSLGNEIQFSTDVDLGWNVAELTKTVAASANVSGYDGNVAAATIVRVITSGLFDTFTVNNVARFAGGGPQEEDASLRERCRSFTQTLRRATKAALEYGAIQTPGAGVTTASAVEPGDGTVSLYVSDGSGSSSPTMTALVQTEINNNWRAAGIVVNVTGGVLYLLTGIDITLTTRAGVNSAAIAESIKNAVVARLAKLKLGESCSQTIIKQAVGTVDPDGILDVTVNSPVGTVSPGANGLLRTTAVNVTVN